MKRMCRGRCTRGELHRLRIHCRQAEALLRLLRGGVHGKSRRWLQRKIRAIRRYSNQLRDDDVLRRWISETDCASQRAMRALIRVRRRAVPKIVLAVDRLRRNERFWQCMRRTLRDVRVLTASTRAESLFAQGLFRELSRFVASIPSCPLETDRLHQLRIAGKRLRYAIECCREIWPDLELGELVEMLRAAQTRLGALHDAQVRERRLGELHVPPPSAEQRAAEVANRESESAMFWNWWLAQPLERTLANTTAEIVSLMRREQTS